jgi:hypothetical protein
MKTLSRTHFWTGPRLFALATVAGVLILFVGANLHLVAVAFSSRPDCVLQPLTEGAANYRAAKPSC